MSTASAAASGKPPVVTRALATALWVLFVIGSVVNIVMESRSHHSVLDPVAIPFTAFPTIGWLLAYRRPRNALGWLFLGIGILASFGAAGQALVELALYRGWEPHGIVMVAAWVQLWFWYPLLIMATGYTMLLFPNGLPSRRWRWLLVALTAFLGVITVMAALAPTVEFGKANPSNPIGLHSDAKDIENTLIFRVSTVAMLLLMLASVGSLAIRFHRSRGVERAQLKWFFLGASAVAATLALAIAWPAYNNSIADDVMFPIALACLPISCGLAVLRYRLYDIDRIVSRTVSYALVSAVLIGLYVGCVALTTSVLSFGSSFGVAASTLAAAAAFQPVRRRVQRVVDRRFDRAAYDAEQTVEAFSTRLRDAVAVDTVRDDLLATVTRAVAPTTAWLWVMPA